MYSLVIHKKAAKFLKSRNSSTKRIIVKKLELLKENPYTHQLLDIKKLIGVENVFRLRIGTIRIIYQIEKQELLILVISAGKRGDVYKKK
ncbi:type II toxin-antitoxin system RelE family toxin [Mariniphaga sp.]|uniref:type II toxin-antitoxin system RelE family toxin n=1 Tax=Mariniphaga sp. TaxID=1954475 RepID=UPI00356580E0